MSGLVVVTGGSRGIGAATARLAARRGWDVCVSYRREEEAASEVVAHCRGQGVGALAVRADVSVEADVVGLFARAEAELGPLRGLVNNAGVVARQSRVEDLDAARIERMLAVNVLGSFLCAREAVRRMRASSGGAMVNLSSRAAVLGGADEYVDYAAAKAGVEALTVALPARSAGTASGLTRSGPA